MAIKRRCLEAGDKLLDGEYEILKVIQSSGMANVYLVIDTNLGKQWCLKEILKSEAGKNEVEYRMLIQESVILKKLNHTNIPRITTIKDSGDSKFIIMDYIQGRSVKDLILEKGRIDQSMAVSILLQVCKVLAYLHNRKNPIFYRDLKPDNIMVQDTEGTIKLVDFGTAVIISEGNETIVDNLGTAGFAAPEQRTGAKYDLRSDIYAFGRTMYYMLTGINPFVEKKGVSLTPIREVDSSLSKGLEVIIEKCTKVNPDERYQTIEEVTYALENYKSLDSDYIKKLQRKVKMTVGLFITSIIFFCMSFIASQVDNSKIDESYLKGLEIAKQSNNVSDYISAIEYKPLELEPYDSLITCIKQDGVFSKQEEKELLNLVNPNILDIKKEKGFADLAYSIGKLYWFFYEGGDSDIISYSWFKDAIDNGSSKNDAMVFYTLSSFKKNIAMSIKESSDSGMYKEYWVNLLEAKNVDSGEIVELQLYNSIADAIISYSYRLRTDGVEKEDILKEIYSMKSFISGYAPISDKSKELFNVLKKKVSVLEEKVNVAYSLGGNS